MKTLTTRDHALVRALVWHVAAFSEDQILNAWWPRTAAGRKNGQRRLRALVHGQLLCRQVTHAKAVERVSQLCEVNFDSPIPDFSELSRRSRAAWSLSQRPVAVYSATPRLRKLMGQDTSMQVHLHTLSHTLGVSAIYLEVRAKFPEFAEHWLGEHECKSTEFREAQPDAFIADSHGRKILALEFAADYPASRFERLDSTLRAKRIPYLVYGAMS